MSGINVTGYSSEHRDAVLDLFDSNTPDYFLVEERPSLEAYLDELPGPAWVALASAGDVVGFGGVSFSNEHSAWIRWGMVDRDHHRGGIGRQLLETRLAWIAANSSARQVRVGTTAAIAGFFQRFGFDLETVIPDGIGPGVARHVLVRRIVVQQVDH